MSGNVVSCPNCGREKSVSREQYGSETVCPGCGRTFRLPKQPAKGKGSTAWVWLIMIGVGMIWWFMSQDTSHSEPKRLPPQRTATYPEQIMPYNGSLQIYTDEERIAPLEIQTSFGANYFVKIVSTYSRLPVMTIFIRGGNTVSVEVPLGSYEIKYASGEKWYGYEHLFGPDTAYTKADKVFTFEETGYQITGYTITLYRVSHGNLSSSRINASQF